MNIESEKQKEKENFKISDGDKFFIESKAAKKPGILRSFLGEIRKFFGGVIDDQTIPKNKPELLQKYEQELGDAEKEAIREGVDFSRCQMDEILAEYQSGRKLEFECFSPYIADYNMATGEIYENNLAPVDKTGIAIGKVLRKLFSRARMISLYDEYNTDMPDSSDDFGRPIRQIDKKDAPQLELEPGVKKNFRRNIESLLKKNSVIKEGDQDGKDYLFISESEKIKEAEELVRKLEAVGHIQRDGEAIYFVNEKSEDPRYRQITLRSKNGRWMCEALDTASFIKPENFEITHLVILPNHFKEQQNKVWEILRVLGIEPTHYHNIFFDEKTQPEKVAQIIKEEIERYQQK